MQVVLKVKRFDGKRSWWQEYRVEVPSERSTVLDVLLKAREQDPSLAVRYSCRMAICGSCGMVINGRPRLACETLVAEVGREVRAEPMWNYPVVRDLVVDMEPFFGKHRAVKPYMIRDPKEIFESDREFGQRPEELDRYLDYSYCIMCGLCYSACPRVAENPRYLGPQALAQAYRWSADSRDRGYPERAKIVDSEDGIWSCHYMRTCSVVCPKGVEPAFAIQLLKFKAMGLWR